MNSNLFCLISDNSFALLILCLFFGFRSNSLSHLSNITFKGLLATFAVWEIAKQLSEDDCKKLCTTYTIERKFKPNLVQFHQKKISLFAYWDRLFQEEEVEKICQTNVFLPSLGFWKMNPQKKASWTQTLPRFYDHSDTITSFNPLHLHLNLLDRRILAWIRREEH